MASHQFRAVERNLSRLYFLELLEQLQDERFLKHVPLTCETTTPILAEYPDAVGGRGGHTVEICDQKAA